MCPFAFVLSFQAYSVYDEEIGYCQGQSFLAAVLLLHVSTTYQQRPVLFKQFQELIGTVLFFIPRRYLFDILRCWRISLGLS